MKLKIQGPKFKNIVIIFGLCAMVCGLVGCDAFVRKFTRKPKIENTTQEEMILAPEEYKGPNMSKEELYRQYFLFWRSWQDELIESLLQRKSQKKQLDCAEEGINNLINLRALLNDATQKELEVYINELKGLKNAISKDLYGIDTAGNAHDAERIKINILRRFSYNKTRDNLK
jgi:hypothetical protein